MNTLTRRITLSVGLVVISITPLHAQTLPAPIQSLLGGWVGEGELFGRPAEFSMDWSTVLGDQFVRLNFHNAMVNDGRADTTLVAVGHYRIHSADSIAGTWHDSRGVTQPLWGHASDPTLVINWGTPETELGRTVYTLTDGGVLVVDAVQSANGWREFARATYRRANR